jgi:hypothetical protein
MEWSVTALGLLDDCVASIKPFFNGRQHDSYYLQSQRHGRFSGKEHVTGTRARPPWSKDDTTE